MKHSQVKGKTLAFTLATEYGEGYKLDIQNRIERFLDAQYYDIKNDLSFTDNGTSFTVKTDKLTKFFFSEEEAENFQRNHITDETLSVLTKDEKVNRFMLEVIGASLEFAYTLPSGSKLDGRCEVTFRSGGDYTVKREGSEDLSYGPKLKARQFTDDGFTVEACNGSVMRYKLS